RGGLHKLTDRLDTIPGTPPPLGATLAGCVFVDRCAIAKDSCRTTPPSFVELANGHRARCAFHEQAASMPRAVDGTRSGGQTGNTASSSELLNISKLSKTFAQDSGDVRVLTEVSLSLRKGETLGLVGESGSGKTTLAKNLLGITQPDEGSVITLNGQTLGATLRDRSASEVGSVQIVFQNPDSALNRRHTVMRIVARAIEKLAGKSRSESEDTAQVLLNDMSVDPILHSVKPSQLSGGLKQRVAIARSFAGKPQLVVCDEPTSALDVSVQANILNLLVDLQNKENVSRLQWTAPPLHRSARFERPCNRRIPTRTRAPGRRGAEPGQSAAGLRPQPPLPANGGKWRGAPLHERRTRPRRGRARALPALPHPTGTTAPDSSQVRLFYRSVS
ncbi:MAG: ATP-binding cassette domain-containing protein, partial [Actinobacteria bacterium]|nr:ATP-binding cassette domain-containing protein [Actinomycetota bacterium]